MADEDIGQETAIFLDHQPDKLRKGDKVYIKSTIESIRAGAPNFEVWVIDSINRKSMWCNVRKEHESRPRMSRRMENGGKWWLSQGSAEADELIEKMLNDLEEEGVSFSQTPDLSPDQAHGEIQEPSEGESDDMSLEDIPTRGAPGWDDAAIRTAYLELQYTSPYINLDILGKEIEKNLQAEDRAYFRKAILDLMAISLDMGEDNGKEEVEETLQVVEMTDVFNFRGK